MDPVVQHRKCRALLLVYRFKFIPVLFALPSRLTGFPVSRPPLAKKGTFFYPVTLNIDRACYLPACELDLDGVKMNWCDKFLHQMSFHLKVIARSQKHTDSLPYATIEVTVPSVLFVKGHCTNSGIVSASLSISIASEVLMVRAYRLASLSVCRSVCPESVLWQNG